MAKKRPKKSRKPIKSGTGFSTRKRPDPTASMRGAVNGF